MDIIIFYKLDYNRDTLFLTLCLMVIRINYFVLNIVLKGHKMDVRTFQDFLKTPNKLSCKRFLMTSSLNHTKLS